MSFKIRAEGGARGADRDAIRRALSIIADPAGHVEVFSLPSGRSARRPAADLDGLVEAAVDLADGVGTYYRINPVGPGAKAANNGDVVARRHLLVDCDPVRPDGVMATDAEKSAGIEQARAVGEFLSARGWPDPLWVDSGSGVQLLYRVDLPNDAMARRWTKAALARIGDETDTEHSKVDRGVFRANQLAKLPGTWVKKGPDEPDRPHRMARLVSVPSAFEVVPADLIGAPAGADTTPEGVMEHGISCSAPANGPTDGHHATPFGVRATARTLDGYVKSAIRRECAIVELTPAGGRNDALNAAAFNLGTMADWPEMPVLPARAALLAAALHAGLEGLESRKTIESGWTAGAARGRARPADARRGEPAAPSKSAGPVGLIVWAKEIRPRKVDWLWAGRIPVGKITTFAGQTGMGKTFATCDIAARVSVGAEIPFAGGECFRRGKVLIISAEDDADDTLVPRLIDLGADLSQIAFLSPAAEADFNLGALELLNDAVGQMAGDVRLVVIDPPTSYLGGVDDHRNAELRGLLAPIRRWSIDRKVAMELITHINKGNGSNLDAMARVMGSAAWVQAVRAAHMFVPDPEIKTRNLFLPLKVNNARKPPGLAYQIVTLADGRVVIEWLCEVDTSPEDALIRTPKKSRGICAVEWLAERFRERREWSSDEIMRAAKEFGISRNAMFSPEVGGLPILKRRRVGADGEWTWYWIAEEGWPEPARGTVGTVGILGILDAQVQETQHESKSPDNREGSGLLGGFGTLGSQDASKSSNSPKNPNNPGGGGAGFLPPNDATRPPGWPEGQAWIYTSGEGRRSDE